MDNNIEGNMRMSFETKMRENAGSMITVVPSGLVKLLHSKSGDKLRWNADITEKGVSITVEPFKEKE